MTDNRAQVFAARVNELEADRDVARFVSDLFREDAELARPEARQHMQGSHSAQAFWEQYLGYFDRIHSDFTRVTDAGQLGILEWTSTGRLRDGQDLTYRGVSLLDFDEDGRVSRFATYYDTAPFHLAPTGT